MANKQLALVLAIGFLVGAAGCSRNQSTSTPIDFIPAPNQDHRPQLFLLLDSSHALTALFPQEFAAIETSLKIRITVERVNSAAQAADILRDWLSRPYDVVIAGPGLASQAVLRDPSSFRPKSVRVAFFENPLGQQSSWWSFDFPRTILNALEPSTSPFCPKDQAWRCLEGPSRMPTVLRIQSGETVFALELKLAFEALVQHLLSVRSDVLSDSRIISLSLDSGFVTLHAPAQGMPQELSQRILQWKLAGLRK